MLIDRIGVASHRHVPLAIRGSPSVSAFGSESERRSAITAGTPGSAISKIDDAAAWHWSRHTRYPTPPNVPGGVPDGRSPVGATAADQVPKYSWIWRMAIDPSPTAEATRLTEPLRTSPTANTPGWLVSSIIG